jgi:hypothetical protein
MSGRAATTKPRGHSRCHLSLPVVFSWRDAQERPHQGTGFTRNISAGGVFLVTRNQLPVGVTIRFEAFLPPMSRQASALRMEGKGEVVRVDPMGSDQGWLGVAVTNTSVALWETERRFPRQELEIPLKFSWKDARGRRHKGTGLARDVSPGGFFFVTRNDPPVGSPIDFEAFLPPVGPNAPVLRLQGEAQLLRVETETTHENQVWKGIAAAAENVVLQDIE